MNWMAEGHGDVQVPSGLEHAKHFTDCLDRMLYVFKHSIALDPTDRLPRKRKCLHIRNDVNTCESDNVYADKSARYVLPRRSNP